VIPKERKAEYYATALDVCPFREWRAGFTDKRTKNTIDNRILRMMNGNFGDSKTIGSGVSEARIFLGPGYRIYYAVHEFKLVLLLGGDKGSQVSDVGLAKEYWRDYQQRILKCKPT
jgi:putative addiction module killer protein